MTYACNGSNMIVRWCDNAIVSVASNCQLSNSSRLISRWSRKQKKRVDVPMPHMTDSYNRSMRVDLFDQFVVKYYTCIRRKDGGRFSRGP